MCIEHVCVNTRMSVYVVENLVELWVKVSVAFIHGWGMRMIYMFVLYSFRDGEMRMVYVFGLYSFLDGGKANSIHAYVVFIHEWGDENGIRVCVIFICGWGDCE